MPHLRQSVRVRGFDVYCEPFAGSGALAFDLIANGFEGQVILNDVDKELMAMFETVRSDADGVDYFLSSWQECDWRVKFHEVKACAASEPVYMAARFIAIQNGSFMCSWSTPKHRRLHYNRDNFFGAARALQNIDLRCGDYADLEPEANWLVYVDPPYLKFAETRNGRDYGRGACVTELGFHAKLRDWLGALPCDWLASNSISAESLYSGHIIAKPKLHAMLGQKRVMTEILAASWNRAA